MDKLSRKEAIVVASKDLTDSVTAILKGIFNIFAAFLGIFVFMIEVTPSLLKVMVIWFIPSFLPLIIVYLIIRYYNITNGLLGYGLFGFGVIAFFVIFYFLASYYDARGVDIS